MDKELLEALRQVMQEELKPINTRLDGLDKRLDGLEEEQRHTRVLMEHMDKRMDALVEGQQGINEKFAKLDKVADDVEDIKIKVSAIEHVTQDNTSQIQQLRKVN